MHARTAAYWVTTGFIALETLAGGATDLMHGREMLVAGRPVVGFVTSLGYPEYVLQIIGTWKLAGAAVLLAPRTPRLKEWAYAGIVFELTGAAASLAARAHGAGDVLTPLVLASLALASWALRPTDRTLDGRVRLPSWGARPSTSIPPDGAA